jgi:hypothetical protein
MDKENVIYIYTMEYYSAIKKNEIMSLTGKWIELKIIILSEISQAEKAKHCVFSFTYMQNLGLKLFFKNNNNNRT